MGWVYVHCRKCDQGLARPTLSEALNGIIDCPHCRYENEISDDVKNEFLIELFERVQKLEDLITGAKACEL